MSPDVIKNKMNILWKFSQKGNLWRLFFSGKDTIVGETRDFRNKRLYLFSVNAEDGKPNFKNLLFENGNFWVSTDGTTDRFIFLHRYEKPEMPFPSSIIALDSISGEKIWENRKYLYFFNTNERLFAYKQNFQDTDYIELNLNTGEEISFIPEDYKKSLFQIRQETSIKAYSDYFYPEILEKDNPDYETIQELEILNQNIKGNIEFLKTNEYFIFNYHVYEENTNQLSNKFCIYDNKNREKLYSDTINKKISANVPDNFFIKHKYLLIIKEKKEIITIKL